MLLPEPRGLGSLWVTLPGLGTSRTGHAGRARGGCRVTARWCTGLMLQAPVPAKPGTACEPTKFAGSRKPESLPGRLRLAPLLAAGSGHRGRGQEGSGRDTQVMAPMGRAAPLNSGWGRWASPHARGATPIAGAAGGSGQVGGRGRAGSMHAAPLDQGSPGQGCWEMRDLEGNRDPRRGGALG